MARALDGQPPPPELLKQMALGETPSAPARVLATPSSGAPKRDRPALEAEAAAAEEEVVDEVLEEEEVDEVLEALSSSTVDEESA